MANMSYCRFHNTLTDLYDCEGALESFLDNDENVISSTEERHKAKQLVELCKSIAERWDPEDIDSKADELDGFDDEDCESDEEEDEDDVI